MTYEEKNERNKVLVEEFNILTQVLRPTAAYRALAQKHRLDWQVVMRNIKKTQAEQD
jgi:hypothetical protein